MVCEEQALLAEEKFISITTQIEPDLYAFADETFYIRMLSNLLSNAIYYGKEKGPYPCLPDSSERLYHRIRRG